MRSRRRYPLPPPPQAQNGESLGLYSLFAETDPRLIGNSLCKKIVLLSEAKRTGAPESQLGMGAFGSVLSVSPSPEVDALFAFADSIEAKVAAAREKTEKLRQSILAKAFSGELVETEAEIARREGRGYETAKVLVERIKRTL